MKTYIELIRDGMETLKYREQTGEIMDRIKLLTIIACIAFLLSITNLAVTYTMNNKLNIIENAINSTTVLQPTPSQEPERVEVGVDDDSVLGKADAPVTMIEFSDYECPFCERFYLQTLPQIEKEYIDTGKLRFVYRDYPLSFHKNATLAAMAAECAGEQDRYREYHDALFQHQNAMDNSSLKKYAADLGLDTASFNQCLDSGTMAEEVQKDFQEGLRLGVRGTPTFFINGLRLVGALPFQSFKQVIDQEINSTEQ
jgi:protein-disulfide isomerase